MTLSRRVFLAISASLTAFPCLMAFKEDDPWWRPYQYDRKAKVGYLASSDVVRVSDSAFSQSLIRLENVSWVELSPEDAIAMTAKDLPLRDGVKPYLLRAVAFAALDGGRRGGVFDILHGDGIDEVVFNTLGRDDAEICHEAVIGLLPAQPIEVYAVASMAE